MLLTDTFLCLSGLFAEAGLVYSCVSPVCWQCMQGRKPHVLNGLLLLCISEFICMQEKIL